MYYVFCIFECVRAPRKMGKCSLGLPSLNKDFIIIIIIIIVKYDDLFSKREMWLIQSIIINIRGCVDKFAWGRLVQQI